MSLSNHFDSLSAKAATASDVTDAPVYSREIPAGFMCATTSGDISVVTDLGDTIVFKTVPLSTPVRLRITRINSTGTTATGLVYLYSRTP